MVGTMSDLPGHKQQLKGGQALLPLPRRQREQWMVAPRLEPWGQVGVSTGGSSPHPDHWALSQGRLGQAESSDSSWGVQMLTAGESEL